MPLLAKCLAVFAVAGVILAVTQAADKNRAHQRPGEPAGPGGMFVGHAGLVHAIKFAPDGQSIATAGADKTIRVWEVVTGKERLKLVGHAGAVWSVAFAPDGKTLAS